jgi:hypothetical protein
MGLVHAMRSNGPLHQVPMGPQCTWKYLQVLMVLNINKINSIKFIVNTNIRRTEEF